MLVNLNLEGQLVMKKLLLLVCVIFCNYSTVYANLAHEKEYWIEEINKTGVLNQNMISKHFDVSAESYKENIFGGSKSDMESWRKTTLVIAEVIKNNETTLKRLDIYSFNHTEFNNFYINTFLDAIIRNKTIKSFVCTRAPANGAFKVADIIKTNKTIKEIELDDAEFTDEGALVIAKSLSTNNTLQMLRILNSKFSMSSRGALRKAWSMNKVEGRQQQIEF
jgi:hypothetical protein